MEGSTPPQTLTSKAMEIGENDSGLASSFEATDCNLYVSTPVTFAGPESGSTPAVVSRKRKVSRLYESAAAAEHSLLLPKFSSTLNESSLLDHLQKCKLGSCARELEHDHSEPTTPLKQLKYGETTPQKTSSPYKEAQKILYPELKQMGAKRIATPFKLGLSFSSPKRQLFYSEITRIDPVRHFQGQPIMPLVFSYLSDADLYRVGKVSTSWLAALYDDKKITVRYQDFVDRYKKNKENYRNTPPSSPPSPESPPSSPNSRNFHIFTKCARKLSPGQSLRKCPNCKHPSVVEKDISQCLNPYCKYIYCLLCLSYSNTGAEDFEDKCQHSQLLVDKRRSRRFCLADLSNSAGDSCTSLLWDSKSLLGDSSGFYSEPERHHVTLKVKRNLSKSLKRESGGVLGAHNQNATPPRRKMQLATVAPVVSCDYKQKSNPDFSPPRLQTPVSSKQSKKNLRRLLL